ncbi:MAG: alanine racemase [Rhizobiales bacterium PAR1]|nr:MAG: alanine racemase [Rhizobiales bacterium PAR1]
MSDHAAILTINLGALVANWRLLAARAVGAECAAVVKADAYGLGIENAVPALAKAGCRTFFVAHLSEAIRARGVAPDATVYVLNGLAADRVPDYRAYRLSAVLGSRAEIEVWRAAGMGYEAPALHVDTGMNRLGLHPSEARTFIAEGGLASLAPSLVLTHFVASEVADDPVTARQIALFSDLELAVRATLGLSPKPRLSLWNSSGHFLGGSRAFDLTRPGYALYGGNPTPGQANPMREVIRLEAPVVQINQVPKGESVGYNANWVAARDSRIATISCGYADGFPRNAGNTPYHNGGSAIIAGIECPFAGNVSMDLITLDITALPEGAVKPGDLAMLIGGPLGVDRVGASGRTTGYEILTGLGRRYRRVLIGAA